MTLSDYLRFGWPAVFWMRGEAWMFMRAGTLYGRPVATAIKVWP